MLTPIGDLDIDLTQVCAVTDVQENPPDPEDHIDGSWAFEIALQGGSLGLVGDSQQDAEEAHAEVLAGLSADDRQTSLATGGVTLDPGTVTAVGPVGEDSDGAVGFEVYFPGSEATLIYQDDAEAENARQELIDAIHGD